MRHIAHREARAVRRRAGRRFPRLSAIVTSAALVAGLGAYPAEAPAQEPPVSASAVSATPTASTATAAPRSAAAETTVEKQKPVTVTREGDTDTVVVSDPTGEAWGYGAKASDEDIFGIARAGEGEIEEILNVTVDGKELAPEFYGYVNLPDAGYLGFDLDALDEIPPREVEFVVRTTGEATYAIAESEEVPTSRELTASGYGRNPAAAATVNPDGVGQARVATLPDSKVALRLNPLGFSQIDGARDPIAPRGTLKTSIGGTRAQRDVYLTELVITHNNTSARYSLGGPITLRKNGGTEYCTVQGDAIRTLSTRDQRYGGSVSKIAVDLTQCTPQIVVWEGSGDRIDVDFYGPGTGNVGRDYSMELYGSYERRATPAPTTQAQAPSGAQFSATSAELALSRVTTTGNNPYSSTVDVLGPANFTGATVSIDAPQSILTGEDYALDVDGVEGSGYALGHTVLTRTNDKVEIEFFPTKGGKRIDALPLADGATFTLTSRFGGNPNATGTITINGQPRETPTTPADDAPAADGALSGEYKLPLGAARLETSPGGGQQKTLTAPLLGRLTRTDVHPTRVLIAYNGPVNNRTASLTGPVTFTKQDGQRCTVRNPRPVTTERQPRGTSVVTAVEVDLTSCPIKFWEGAGDTMSVTFGGPGGATGSTDTYVMEAWGRREQASASVQPGTGGTATSPTDANGKCVSGDPETAEQPRLAMREIPAAERARGTEVYASTSEAANGNNQDRAAMTHTLLSVQQQGSDQFVPVGSSNWIYNGLAYNPEDNWLYAISQYRGSSSAPDPCYPAGHLLQIDPTTGAVRNLGEVRDALRSPFSDRDGARDRTLINAGVFYNGALYVSNSAQSGSRDMYRVQLPAVGASNPSGRNLGYKVYSEDYAILPDAPQYAWGLVSQDAYRDAGCMSFDWLTQSWQVSDGVCIERINLATGKVDNWVLTESEARANAGGKVQKKVTWGKAWTYGNGNLGFAQGGQSVNGTNPGVQIMVTNPSGFRPTFKTVALLDRVPDSYNTDAASSARRTPPSKSDLELEKVAVTKDDGRTYPGFDKRTMQAGRTYWAIRLKNLGPDVSPGAVVTDEVPRAYTDVRLESEFVQQNDGFVTDVELSPNTRTPASDGLFGTGATDFQYIFGPLQKGDEVWMYISATLKDRQQCVVNTASVTNNDSDPNPGNNTAQSDCPPAVEVHKAFAGPAVDGSHLTRNSDGTYTVSYQIAVENETSAKATYEPPADEITVPRGFTLRSASVTYTNEQSNQTQRTCTIDDSPYNRIDSTSGRLRPRDFPAGQTRQFRLQDCRAVDSPYLGFEGRDRRESDADGQARYFRNIDPKSGRSRGMHTYDVEMTFSVDENAYVLAYPDYGQEGVCEAELGGLTNRAWIGDTPSERPCTTPPIDRPDLEVKKVAHDNRDLNLSDSGVEFSVFEARDGSGSGSASGSAEPGSLGSGSAEPVAVLQPTGDVLTSDRPLAYGREYLLVETRAPQGFSLLAEPVKFRIVKVDGRATVEFTESTIVAEAGKGERSLAVMTVADVRRGDLPKTGGVGVGVPMLTGLLIVAAGIFTARRRV